MRSGCGRGFCDYCKEKTKFGWNFYFLTSA